MSFQNKLLLIYVIAMHMQKLQQKWTLFSVMVGNERGTMKSASFEQWTKYYIHKKETISFLLKKLKNGKNKRKDLNFDTCHLRKKWGCRIYLTGSYIRLKNQIDQISDKMLEFRSNCYL